MKTDTKTTNEETAAKPERRKRYWLAVRIVDYRLQALAPEDPADPEGEMDWCDIGADTMVSSDREAVYQLARTHSGLLLSMDGLPRSGRLAAMVARATASPDAY